MNVLLEYFKTFHTQINLNVLLECVELHWDGHTEGSATIPNHVDGSRNHFWNQGINRRFLNREPKLLRFFLDI